VSPGKAAAPGRATEGERESSAGGRNLDIDSINLDAYLEPADRLMLAALRGGTYVLAVRCRICGAPLTAKRSRLLGVGPDCRRKDGAF
jgi:hypothetical protein